MKFIFAILFLVVVPNEGLAEKCLEDNMKKCFSKLEDIAIRQMISVQKSEKASSSYCKTLEQDGKCQKDMPKSCEADFPEIAESASMLYLYLSEFCSETEKLYMDMIPCFEANKAVFQTCAESHEKSKREAVSQEDTICKEVKSMQCLAKLSKVKCKNGEAFGNALEKRMEIMDIDLCSHAGNLANSFLTFAITVLSVLLIRNKFQ